MLTQETLNKTLMNHPFSSLTGSSLTGAEADSLNYMEMNANGLLQKDTDTTTLEANNLLLPFDQDLFEDLVKEIPQFDDFRQFLPQSSSSRQRSNSVSLEYSRPRAPRSRFLSAGHDFLGCGQPGEVELFPSNEQEFDLEQPFKFISLQDLDSSNYKNEIGYQSHPLNIETSLDVCDVDTKTKAYPSPTSPPLSPTLFSCDKCLKTFKKIKDWKRHLNTHDQKSFECQDCLKKFSRKDALTRHIKKLRCIFIKRMLKEQSNLKGTSVKTRKTRV